MTYGQLVGKRTDIDLRTKWWHRLVSVLYLVAFALVSLIALAVAWSSAVPAATESSVVIYETLQDVADRAAPTENFAATFANRPGRLGLRQANGTIDYLSEYGMRDTVCMRKPLDGLEEVASTLNRRSYTQAYSAEAIGRSLRQKYGDKAEGICWYDSGVSSLSDRSWRDAVKYDFTWLATANATFTYLSWTVVGLFAAHMLFSLVYYRGIVYIIVGPRQTTTS